jgi:hypothetical protein
MDQVRVVYVVLGVFFLQVQMFITTIRAPIAKFVKKATTRVWHQAVALNARLEK